jgi:hypothetical protein
MTASAGSKTTIDLPRDNIYKKLILRLAGTVTISGGSTSGTVVAYSPFTLIDRIDIRVNGKDTIKSLSGVQLFIMNSYDAGGDNERTTLANGDIQAGTSIAGTLNLGFILPRGLANYRNSTLFNSYQYDPVNISSLDIEVTWNANLNTAIITGGDRTVATGTTTLTITTEEVVPTAVVVPQPGEMVITKKSLFPVNKETSLRQPITGANDELSIRNGLNLGNLYRRIFLFIYDNSALSDTLVTNVIVRLNGVEYLINEPMLSIKNQDAIDYNLLATQLKTGVISLDFDPELNGKGYIPTKDATDFEILVKNIAGSGTRWIDVVQQEITPPVV